MSDVFMRIVVIGGLLTFPAAMFFRAVSCKKVHYAAALSTLSVVTVSCLLIPDLAIGGILGFYPLTMAVAVYVWKALKHVGDNSAFGVSPKFLLYSAGVILLAVGVFSYAISNRYHVFSDGTQMRALDKWTGEVKRVGITNLR